MVKKGTSTTSEPHPPTEPFYLPLDIQMTFRIFILGLSASFGVAWLSIIVLPYLKMRSLEPVSMGEDANGTSVVFNPKRAGRITDGSEVYAANGCYQCHSQLIRPTYAGNDLYRADWAGLVYDDERGDTRRETTAYDYAGEKFAHIGVARIGPDLSNLAVRVENIYAKGSSGEQWLYTFLYNPRLDPKRRHSTCPSNRFLFEERKITGNPSDRALPISTKEGYELVPKPEARALVSYLLSLKKDQAVPASLNFAPAKAEEPKAP
jgi:cytochrome c oxidase cbb3-type subunit II